MAVKTPCIVTYKGQEMPYGEYLDMLANGEYDKLVEAKVINIEGKGGAKPPIAKAKATAEGEGKTKQSQLQSTMEKEGFIKESDIRATYETKNGQEAAREGLELLREVGDEQVIKTIVNSGTEAPPQKYTFAGLILVKAYENKATHLAKSGKEQEALDMQDKANKLAITISTQLSQTGQTNSISGLALSQFENSSLTIDALVHSALKETKIQDSITDASHITDTDAEEVNKIISEAIDTDEKLNALKDQLRSLSEENGNLKEQLKAIAEGKQVPQGNPKQQVISKKKAEARKKIKEGLDELFGALAVATGGTKNIVQSDESIKKGAIKALEGIMEDAKLTFEQAFEQLKDLVKNGGYNPNILDNVVGDLRDAFKDKTISDKDKQAKKALAIIKSIEKSNVKAEEKLADDYTKPDKPLTREERLLEIFDENPEIAQKLIDRYENAVKKAVELKAAKKVNDFYLKKRKEKDSNASVSKKEQKNIVDEVLKAFQEAETAERVLDKQDLKEAYVVAKNNLQGIQDLEGLQKELDNIKKKLLSVEKGSVAHQIYMSDAIYAINQRIPISWFAFTDGASKGGMLSGLPTLLNIYYEGLVGRATALLSLGFNPQLLAKAYKTNGFSTKDGEKVVGLPSRGWVNSKILWKYNFNMANQGAVYEQQSGKQTYSQFLGQKTKGITDKLKAVLPVTKPVVDAWQGMKLYDSVFKAITTPDVMLAPATNYYHVAGQVYQQELIKAKEEAKVTGKKVSNAEVIKRTFDRIAVASAKAHNAAYEKAMDMYKGKDIAPLIVQAEAYNLLDNGFVALDGTEYQGVKEEVENANYINRTQNLSEARNIRNSVTGEIEPHSGIVNSAINWVNSLHFNLLKSAEKSGERGDYGGAIAKAGGLWVMNILTPFVRPLFLGTANAITATTGIANIQMGTYAYKRSATGEKLKNAALASFFINPYANDPSKTREFQEYNNLRSNALQGYAMLGMGIIGVMALTPDDDEFDDEGKYKGAGSRLINTGALEGMPSIMKKGLINQYGKDKLIWIDKNGNAKTVLGLQNMMSNISFKIPFVLSNYAKYNNPKYVVDTDNPTKEEKKLIKQYEENMTFKGNVINTSSLLLETAFNSLKDKSWNYGAGVIIDFASAFFAGEEESWKKEIAYPKTAALVGKQAFTPLFISFFSSIDDLTNSNEKARAWDESKWRKGTKTVLYSLPFSEYFGVKPRFNMFGDKVKFTSGSTKNPFSTFIEFAKANKIEEAETKQLILDNMTRFGVFPKNTWLKSDMCYIDEEGTKPITEGMKYDAEYYAAKYFYNDLKNQLSSENKDKRNILTYKPENVNNTYWFAERTNNAMRNALKKGKMYSLYKNNAITEKMMKETIKDEDIKLFEEIYKKGKEEGIPLSED